MRWRSFSRLLRQRGEPLKICPDVSLDAGFLIARHRTGLLPPKRQMLCFFLFLFRRRGDVWIAHNDVIAALLGDVKASLDLHRQPATTTQAFQDEDALWTWLVAAYLSRLVRQLEHKGQMGVKLVFDDAIDSFAHCSHFWRDLPMVPSGLAAVFCKHLAYVVQVAHLGHHA